MQGFRGVLENRSAILCSQLVAIRSDPRSHDQGEMNRRRAKVPAESGRAHGHRGFFPRRVSIAR